jgi:ureidoacrylate peracid hydrolase
VTEREGLHHLLLQATDLEAAEAFFIGFLGFGVRKREALPDGRPLTVTTQGLGLTHGRRGEPGAVVDHIAFHTHDIRGIAARAEAEGITVLKPLGPGPYGLTVNLADPDGNRIELFSEDEE